MRKLGYYLSVAYYDLPFRLTFAILASKLLLFTYITGLGIDSYIPALGGILATLSFSLIIRDNIFKLLYLFVLNLLYSLIMVSHSLYLKYFDDFASVYTLAQVHQLPSIADEVIYLFGKELLLVGDLIFFPLLYFRVRQKYDYNTLDKIKALVLIILLGVYSNIGPLTFHMRIGNNYFRSISDRYDFALNMGIINYQITDIYNYLMTKIKRARLTPDDINLVSDWEKRRNKRVKENGLTGVGKGKNLIVIQVESLQNIVINKRYNGVEITPNLNKLAKKGIYFNNIYDQTADGSSSDATLLSNSSLYPARKGATSFLYPDNCFDSLPKALREHGYATATMHAYKKSYWNREIFERSLGFEYQFYEDDYIMTDKVGWGLSDKSFFSQSAEKIKGLSTPFYAFLTTLSSHPPFTYVTPDIDGFPLHELEGQPLGNYMRSMHYVDSAIGEFLRDLTENNLMTNTVVVVYGDHRARLPYSESKKIGVSDTDEIWEIPVIIGYPDIKQNGVRDTIGGLIDVTPTVCNILGVDATDKYFLGKDLENRDLSYVIFRNGSYIGKDGPMNKNSAHEQLMISDLILEKDIIPKLGKGNCTDSQQLGKGSVRLEELIAHAGGGINGLTYTNSIEALNANYEKGFRFFEIDLEWTSDRHLVLVHDWDDSISRLFGVKPGNYSLSEFKNFKMTNGFTQMTLDDLADWLKKNHDAYVVTDIKRDNIQALKLIDQRYPEIKHRTIPQIYRFREYNEVRKLGFDTTILTLYASNYSDKDVLGFLKDNHVAAVTMPIGRAKSGLPRKLKEMGIFAYTHTVNDEELKNKLRSNGIDGFYTDFLEIK